MLRPRINACLCPRQERSLWRCRSAWLMKALPRTGWEQLLVVAGGKLVAGAQWRWDGASYLLAPHRRSSTPRSGVATEHEKKREKNERHGEKRKHKRFLLPTTRHIYEVRCQPRNLFQTKMVKLLQIYLPCKIWPLSDELLSEQLEPQKAWSSLWRSVPRVIFTIYGCLGFMCKKWH